jgi:hypothetical protein
VTATRTSRERLEAMGIDVWVLRSSETAVPGPVEPPDADAGAEPTASPRVRMASGDGDWLIVQDDAWDGRHDRLLGDIQATIGSARCRFGQWAHSETAGVSLDELASRDVRHVLSFGPVPGRAGERVLVPPTLDDIHRRPDARQRLWRLLAEALDD